MAIMVKMPGGSLQPAIRPLNESEENVYTSAAALAATILPAYRDAIALMRPYMDLTASTAYIDKFSRVAISPWFLTLSSHQKASVILHECSHVLHDYFARAEAMSADMDLSNVASDLEINSGLVLLDYVDLSFAIHPIKPPYQFQNHMSQEQYYKLLHEKQKKDEEKCPKHGPEAPDPTGGPPQPDEKESDGPASSDDEKKDGPGKEDKDGEPGEKTESSNSGEKSEDGSDSKGDPGEKSEGDEKSEGNDSDDSSKGDDGSPSAGEDSAGSPSEGEGSDGSPSDGQDGKPSDSGSKGGKPQEKCTCGKDDKSPGQGQGAGGPPSDDYTQKCDSSTEQREISADEAGIDKASDIEQSIARRNTESRIEEEAKKARAAGKGSQADFFERTLERMQPPKADWRKIFRRSISRHNESIVRGRSDYSYRRVSRRLSDSQFIFPGMVTYLPKAMIGVDTSGSMQDEDFFKTLYEIVGLLKSSSSIRNNLKIFSVDTKVQNIKPISNPTKIEFQGRGGTSMHVAWQYVNSLPKRDKPNIFVLSTDGHTSWPPVEKEIDLGKKNYFSVILVTTKTGYETVPQSLKDKCLVIDISED